MSQLYVGRIVHELYTANMEVHVGRGHIACTFMRIQKPSPQKPEPKLQGLAVAPILRQRDPVFKRLRASTGFWFRCP